MPFVIALGFVLAVYLGGEHGFFRYFLAVATGLGLGIWLTALLDARIRRQAGAPGTRPTPAPDDNAAIFAALEDIHWRLKRLEEAQGLGPSPLEAAQDEAGPAPGAAEAATAPGAKAPALASPATAAREQATPGALPPEPKPAALHAPAPPSPRPPSGNSLLDTLVARARNWLLGGNTVVRVGIVVLFFGVAFLLKFAIDRAILPLELRVAGIGAGALALLGIGWHLRPRREAYALALQGAGVGLLYLTLFGAFRLYHLLPPGVALAALVTVAALSTLLALLQNSAALVAIGVTGGFLAPILASTGSGNHVALFSYYMVLNLGIFAVAWFRAWRPLNLLGFFFTAAIGLLWGTRSYEPALFASTEPFLVIFFLMYLAISVLFALRQDQDIGAWASELAQGRLPRRVVDGTLVFGLPLLAFGFQAGMLRGSEFGLAYSALALAALYLGLARALQDRAGIALLTDSFLALGVIFATLAIPLALDARWTAASWALEGAALVWVGVHQQRRSARAFGLFLQLAAALAWTIQPGGWHGGLVPLANAYCLGALLIAASGLFSAWQLQARQSPASPRALPVFCWGLAWWLLAGLGEAHRQLGNEAFHAVLPLFLAASALLLSRLAQALDWPHARLPAAALVVGLALAFLLARGEGLHAFAAGGWLTWPTALGLHYYLLHGLDAGGRFPAWSERAHAIGLWLLALLGSHELHQAARHLDLAGGWQVAALVMVPGALLLAASTPARAGHWPLRQAPASYLGWGAAPLLAAFMLWVLLADLTHAASPAPLPWLPLLNPVDLAHVFLGLTVFAWVRRVCADASLAHVLPTPRTGAIVLGLLAFHWLNAVLLRSIHHWAGVPYAPHELLASTLVQAALSLFWTVLALLLMATAARRSLRTLWMVGAGLMAVVVAKLFLVDLERVGSVARIVSFLGVGLLMLLIGYLAPVPPRPAPPPGADAPEA